MNDKWDMVKSRGKSRDASVNSLGGIQSVVYEVSVGWFLFPNLVDVTSWFNLEDWGTMCIRNLQWNIVRVNPTRWGICNTANYSFAMNSAGHGYEEWNGCFLISITWKWCRLMQYFCKTETWTHLPSRDVWKIATSWVRIPNACLVIEGASPISEILFDSGLHIGLHENTGRNCWCSSSIGGMESLPFSAWDWVAEHPRMQPNTIFNCSF